MAKLKLGDKEFDVDRVEIHADGCRVTDADCVELGARMRSGEFASLKILKLVKFFPFCVLCHLL
jgi:hypothetical protein